MPSRVRRIVAIALAASGMVAVPGAAAKATDAEVRFLHAVPGVGPATLSVSGGEVGSAGFGKATEFATVPANGGELALAIPGGDTLMDTAQLESGRAYTVVAMAVDGAAELLVYEDEPAVAGKARLRMIHASPELGSPNVTLGGEPVAEGAMFQDATRYWTLEPGDYEFRVENPANGEPVFEPQQLALAAGTSSTVVLLGGGGEQAQAQLISDSVAAPSAAPAGGFGGLSEESAGSWMLAALAALLAGGLGATLWLIAMRARIGRDRGVA